MQYYSRNIGFYALNLCLAFGIALTMQSCIDDSYDLNKGISTEMAVGGKALTFPLGKMDSIILGKFLKPEDITMLALMGNNGYSLTIKDSMNVEIPKIDKSSLLLEDKIVTQTQQVDFGEMSLDSFSVDGISVNSESVITTTAGKIDDIIIDPISKQSSYPANVTDYKLTNLFIRDTENSNKQDNMFSSVNVPIVAPTETIIDIPDSSPISIGSMTNNLAFSIDVPFDVTNIDRINLVQPNAVLEITMELAEATLLTAGDFVPNITLNIPSLLEIANAPTTSALQFGTSESLTKANNFKVTKTYPLSAFIISDAPVNGKINISKNVTSTGTLVSKNLKIKAKDAQSIKGIDYIIKIAIKNLVIESMDFDIPKLIVEEKEAEPITLEETISGDIQSVNKIYFESPSQLTIKMSTENLPKMINSKMLIENFKISFPSAMIIAPMSGLSGNIFTLTNETFNTTTGRTIVFDVLGMNLNKTPVINGKIGYKDSIKFESTFSYAGRMNSKNVPTTESNDIRMLVDLSSDLTFKNADVTTKDIVQPLPASEFAINFDLDIAKEVKQLDVVNLKEGTKLTIDIVQPSMPLNIEAKELKMNFPPLFGFKPIANLVNNIYTINGTIPSKIELDILTLNINKPLVDGKIALSEKVTVNGEVLLKSGEVNSDEIKAIDGKKFLLQAKTTDIAFGSNNIQLNTITAEIKDSSSFDVNINDLPTEIASLDSIIVSDDAQIELIVELKNMPTLNAPLMAKVDIEFPELLMFKNGFVNSGNILKIDQELVNNQFKKVLKIRGLKFDGKPLNGKLDLKNSVMFTGSVSIDNPSINTDDFAGRKVDALVMVKITGISFTKVYGVINPAIEAQNTEVKLSDLPEFLKNDSIVLDVDKPVISIVSQGNFSIPITTKMKIIPQRNGVDITEGTQNISLTLPKSLNGNMVSTGFWVSPVDLGKPDSYQFIQTDLPKLFRKVPDNIKMVIEASTVKTEQHVLDLSTEFKMKIAYDVIIPLSFGKDFSIRLEDTLNIDESIRKLIFSGGGLDVMGKIVNNIPLNLKMTLIPMDNKNQVIPIAPLEMTIKAGAKDGSGVESIVDLKTIDPKKLLNNLSWFKLVFTAKSNATVAGAQLNQNNFVRPDLRIRVNGGIRIAE